MKINNIDHLRTHPSISFFFRMVVAVIFIYAGSMKINQPGEFAFAIQSYQIIPVTMTNLLAVILPWLEILCGICLILGLFSRGSALILAGLTVIFIISVSRALISGLEINCGCYGDNSPVDIIKIVEDIFLLLGCLHLLWYPSKFLTLDYFFKRLP